MKMKTRSFDLLIITPSGTAKARNLWPQNVWLFRKCITLVSCWSALVGTTTRPSMASAFCISPNNAAQQLSWSLGLHLSHPPHSRHHHHNHYAQHYVRWKPPFGNRFVVASQSSQQQEPEFSNDNGEPGSSSSREEGEEEANKLQQPTKKKKEMNISPKLRLESSFVLPHFITLRSDCDDRSDNTNNNNSTAASSTAAAGSNNNNNNNNGYRETLLRLAKWSLEDYEWRSSVFKANQADRMVEETLARMTGKKAASYVRPMDASEDTIGPLGQWEKSAVTWLQQVLDEEGRRAQQIVAQQGRLIRPIDVVVVGDSDKDHVQSSTSSSSSSASSSSSPLGPLGQLEKAVVDWIRTIQWSEGERVRTQTLRPMDLEESVRGPLGQLEQVVSNFFRELRESEMLRLRLQQQQQRQGTGGGGGMVRPIDVPGPMGELELWIGQMLRAEELRAQEQQERRQHLQQQLQQQFQSMNQTTSIRNNSMDNNYAEPDGINNNILKTNRAGLVVVRPKDAKIKGPLGEVEEKAFEFLDRLSAEEMERLRNMEQYLRESRPMERDRQSFLGAVEAIVVGLIRAPLLLFNVINRVRELLFQSQVLPVPTIHNSGESSNSTTTATEAFSFDPPSQPYQRPTNNSLKDDEEDDEEWLYDPGFQ